MSIISHEVKKDRIAEFLSCKFFYEIRDGSWVNHASYLFMQVLLYLKNVFFKAHVKHFVSLIKNLESSLVELHILRIY